LITIAERTGPSWTGATSIFRLAVPLIMLTALVLICSVAVAPELGDCTRSNATAVMRVPAEFASPATCFMYGQAYLAGTSIGQDLREKDRVKIVCARN
jgi:hypothetical protein